MRKTYRSKRRYGIKKRRYSKKTAGRKIGRSMQQKSYSYVRKKYTVVQPITAIANQDLAFATISHFGGKNSTNPLGTVTLNNADPDGMTTRDMASYQYFRITGMAFKLFFPEGTTPEATPVQWSMGYSNNLVLDPNLPTERLQTLASYQTSSCSARVPVSRYFKTIGAQKRLGIEWCNTSEFANFGANPPTTLYNGQLAVNSGASTNFKVFRARTASVNPAQIGRIQVTYYVQYKGPKGLNPLV